MEPVCFGRYILLDRIASGGMGEVFVALTRNSWGFEKLFAVKKILPGFSRDPEFLLRFQDEARLVIPLNHPNIVQVFEVGRVGEDYFLAMELVEGPNLGQLLARLYRLRHQTRLAVPAALFITREILSGLDYCHHHTDSAGSRLGMVHRDVSPSNVLLSYDGAVKLTDFGLALSKLKDYQTKPNELMGHLGYMAPEALEQKRVDHRADLFCTGVLLFELLTCERFAPGRDPSVFKQMLRKRSRVRPSNKRNDIPSDVDDLVAKALALDPDQRFGSAQEFHDAVQRALVRQDALFGAKKLSRTVMEPLFRPAESRQRLQDLIQSLDLEEIVEHRPVARTVCLGEAIPLQPEIAPRPVAKGRGFAGEHPILTLLENLVEGDTERVHLAEELDTAKVNLSRAGCSSGRRVRRRPESPASNKRGSRGSKVFPLNRIKTG